MGAGRPPSGEEWVRKTIPLPKGMVETIDLIRQVAPTGKPSFVEAVRKAMQEYIDHQLQSPDIRAGVDRLRRQRVKVVTINRPGKHGGP